MPDRGVAELGEVPVGDGVIADPEAGRRDRPGRGREVPHEVPGQEERGGDAFAPQGGQDRRDRVGVGAGVEGQRHHSPGGGDVGPVLPGEPASDSGRFGADGGRPGRGPDRWDRCRPGAGRRGIRRRGGGGGRSRYHRPRAGWRGRRLRARRWRAAARRKAGDRGAGHGEQRDQRGPHALSMRRRPRPRDDPEVPFRTSKVTRSGSSGTGGTGPTDGALASAAASAA